MADLTESPSHADRRLVWGAAALGFALGGFFDGILLHQILQWHHLLSGVAPSETAPDLRFQVLADGLFHLLSYVLALAGLWLMWVGRDALGAVASGRHLFGWALVGFGAWHILDAVLVHWILQLHRIRMDVDNPLLWDLLWLVPFGIGVLAAGLWLLRKPPADRGGPGRGGGGPGRGRTAAASLSVLAVLAGPIAALPPADLLDDDLVLVVFRPGLPFDGIVAAVDAVDGGLLWTDQKAGVWLIALGPEARPATLYRHGALMVSQGPVAVGCLSWTALDG
jgi:uncharacterized membrane protein